MSKRTYGNKCEEFHNGFFRFSVGIEDEADIIQNLRRALEKVGLL